MNKHGLIIIGIGMSVIIISLSIATSLMPSNVTGPDDLYVFSLFEGMFDEIFDNIVIMPGDSTYVSYSVFSADTSLLWGIQIIDYQSSDKLLVKISDIFGDSYGEFTQNESIEFQTLNLSQSNTLNFEIENLGLRNVDVVVMFLEDPENSESMSNPSPTMNMLLPFAISGFLLILGIIIFLTGIIVLLVDLKNNQNNKRNY